jgi:hypothetical protein
MTEQVKQKVDDGDFAVCNHCGCELKDDCRRYDMSILACYNFEYLKTCFDCFVKKEGILDGQMS